MSRPAYLALYSRGPRNNYYQLSYVEPLYDDDDDHDGSRGLRRVRRLLGLRTTIGYVTQQWVGLLLAVGWLGAPPWTR